MMKKEQYVPNAILILDYSVPYDVSTQYAPFFEEGLSEIPFKENDKIKIIIKGQNKGHVPISREETMDLIYKTLYQD